MTTVRVSRRSEVSVCFVLFFSLQYVVNAYDHPKNPSGGCVLGKAFKESVSCHPNTQYTPIDSYVPDNTLCISTRGDSCFLCQEDSMVEVECPSVRQLDRHKRGFFKKIFRKIRPSFNPFRHIPKPGRFFPLKNLNLKGLNIFGGFKGFKFNFKNTAPKITCPTLPREVIAPQGRTTAAVRWSAPKVSDKENNIKSTRLQSGKASGSQFGEGRHTITYKTTDAFGVTAVCSVSFTVKVIRCPSPKVPGNGGVRCSGTVYGNTCTYRCNSGYRLSGSAKATCQRNGHFTTPPTCQKIQCAKLALPSHAKTTTCTDGNRYQSVCMLTCNHGYRPTRGAKSVCSQNKKWTQTSWKCEDTEKPVFTNCPSKKINTVDKTFRWESLKATDNSGKVNLTQVLGPRPGSSMNFGVHIIKYVAADTSGNSASCVFTVELKKSDCPNPSTEDPDMKFLCNGLTAQSVCHLSCESGSYVQGSKYIVCVQDDTENNTSYWEPIDGEKATCFKKSCPALLPPKNGALACDKQLGGTVCQIQCDDRYDVAPGEGTPATFVCGKNTQAWQPNNVVPDCLEMAFPDEYFLPTEFFYFLGDCSDPEALREIKQQFIDNLNSIGLSPCMSDACSVDDIDVTCGSPEDGNGFDFRRKRRAIPNSKGVIHVRLTFHLKNSNRTISPEAAKALLQSLAEKSKNMMSTNTAMRKLMPQPVKPKISARPSGRRVVTHRKIGFGFSSRRGSAVAAIDRQGIIPRISPTIIPPKLKSKSVTGSLSMECAKGLVQLKSKPGICVPCSVGTYHDLGHRSCKPCPTNTYQTIPGSTTCQPCPPHHITSSTGSASKDHCKALCEKDTFSPTGTQPCYPCTQGHYQPTFGAKTCDPCPASKVKGQGSPLCNYSTNAAENATDIAPEFQISDFLLTCDSEVCLSF